MHWRNLGGHFLQKLGQGGSGRGDSIPKSGEALLVEARVRERSLSRGNSDEGASANTSASARRAHRRDTQPAPARQQLALRGGAPVSLSEEGLGHSVKDMLSTRDDDGVLDWAGAGTDATAP